MRPSPFLITLCLVATVFARVPTDDRAEYLTDAARFDARFGKIVAIDPGSALPDYQPASILHAEGTIEQRDGPQAFTTDAVLNAEDGYRAVYHHEASAEGREREITKYFNCGELFSAYSEGDSCRFVGEEEVTACAKEVWNWSLAFDYFEKQEIWGVGSLHGVGTVIVAGPKIEGDPTLTLMKIDGEILVKVSLAYYQKVEAVYVIKYDTWSNDRDDIAWDKLHVPTPCMTPPNPAKLCKEDLCPVNEYTMFESGIEVGRVRLAQRRYGQPIHDQDSGRARTTYDAQGRRVGWFGIDRAPYEKAWSWNDTMSSHKPCVKETYNGGYDPPELAPFPSDLLFQGVVSCYQGKHRCILYSNDVEEEEDTIDLIMELETLTPWMMDGGALLWVSEVHEEPPDPVEFHAPCGI